MLSLKHQIIQFITMVLVGMMFNPMNVLAYRFNDLYISTTLFYGGLLMASNMIWSHEIVHYLSMGHFSLKTFIFGAFLSVGITLFLLRKQFMVTKKQWLKRMISHHSTALTTTNKLISDHKNLKDNKQLFKLANDIIDTQEREISIMKSMLSKHN